MKYLFGLLFLTHAFVNAQKNTSNRDAKATILEGKQYLTGLNKPYDPQKALELFKQSALNGNAEAMNALGMQYRLALGVDSDMVTALQWFQKAAVAGYAKAWYNLGIMYKYGIGCTQDFNRSYSCFKSAAEMNEPLGYYAQGYMLYKGFGCSQDYNAAYTLFKKGAIRGKASCMYFTGLCYRNGYGVTANLDSAKYWLNLSSQIGYHFSLDELVSKEPENNFAAAELLAKIKLLQSNALPELTVNKYHKIEQSIKASDIEGIYSGYLIQYDWSGEHIIKAHSLNLAITKTQNILKGLWVEDDTLSIPIEASLTKQSLLFKNTAFTITDHYSKDKPIRFNFKDASLHEVIKSDSLFFAGNINLYSPDRKEPEKPFYVILTRTVKGSNDTSQINLLTNALSNKLKVYPNPFTNILTLEFQLEQTCSVYTQLITADGKIIYTNPAEQLAPGTYRLPVKLNIPAGVYIVKLYNGKEVKTAMVVKQ